MSFTTKITNPSLWGYYTNHSGVALIFDYREGEEVDFRQYGEEIKSEKLKLRQVIYGDREPINFFMTIGNLFGDEGEHWLSNKKKRVDL